MECLADCGEGPVVMVGEQTYEKVEEKTLRRFQTILKINSLIPKNMSVMKRRSIQCKLQILAKHD